MITREGNLARKIYWTRVMIRQAGANGVPLEFLPIPIVKDLQNKGEVVLKDGYVFSADENA